MRQWGQCIWKRLNHPSTNLVAALLRKLCNFASIIKHNNRKACLNMQELPTTFILTFAAHARLHTKSRELTFVP